MVKKRSVSPQDPKEEAAVSTAQRHGEVPLSLTKKRRRWTPTEKQAIVMETYQPGMSISLIARKYGITPSGLYHWRKCSQEGAIMAVKAEDQVVPVAEFNKLKEEVRRLQRILGMKTEEVEILKEAVTIARKKKLISYKPLQGVDGFQ